MKKYLAGIALAVMLLTLPGLAVLAEQGGGSATGGARNAQADGAGTRSRRHQASATRTAAHHKARAHRRHRRHRRMGGKKGGKMKMKSSKGKMEKGGDKGGM